ncbi:uncharacterized protein NECHADRAFT_81578 [Fusarium vanettenii 77-13-4]|uniref:Uncharacterized protein n=1 Tax=Fusarium vanettenii (strain ATCC MYA-4622 / CBS 123669 / FGSC 9596 / NRRL 45880 / 77-13-4) TaxID=660122 RepID=C7Z971_FUSV7|nr:uncharacterized protein NECHADRAFT_81578 [Fusarium vanettenii 77-13-4]EEU39423.1 predicted protein [Fusarium vanettenii 77-13-4]
MSLLATYSAVLSKFTYDAAANFWKMDLGEVPCMYCLEHMDKDPRIPCITDQSPNCCLLCAHDKKKCGSIWRANRAVKDVAYAWRKVADRLRDPMSQKSKDALQLSRVQTQELASNRELLSLLCLQGLLLEAIDRLDGAENNPRTDVEVEGSDRDIAVDDGNPGPTCPVSFVGQGPRLRGPADPSSTPGGRKRARPADGGDNDDEAPDPSPSRPPKRARKTRSQTARGGGRGGRGGGRGGANNNP